MGSVMREGDGRAGQPPVLTVSSRENAPHVPSPSRARIFTAYVVPGWEPTSTSREPFVVGTGRTGSPVPHMKVWAGLPFRWTW